MSKETKLIHRLAAVKERLPNQYVKVFTERFPEYDTPKKRDLIRRVVNFRSLNEDVISKLEQIIL